MSSPVLRVVKWDCTFETSDSRRHKMLSWVSVPVSMESTGYLSMVVEFGDRAPAIFGAWIALVKIAAKCPVRGVLSNSKGVGYTTSQFSLISRFPQSIFEELIEWAVRDDVRWLEITDSNDSKRSPNDHQTIDERSANERQTNDNRLSNDLRDVTRPNVTLPNETQPDPTEPEPDRSSSVKEKFSWSCVGRRIDRFLRTSKLPPKALPADLLAVAAGFDLMFSEGFLSGIAESFREGKVNRPKPYLQSSLERRCEEIGMNWRDCELQIQEILKEAKYA